MNGYCSYSQLNFSPKERKLHLLILNELCKIARMTNREHEIVLEEFLNYLKNQAPEASAMEQMT